MGRPPGQEPASEGGPSERAVAASGTVVIDLISSPEEAGGHGRDAGRWVGHPAEGTEEHGTQVCAATSEPSGGLGLSRWTCC